MGKYPKITDVKPQKGKRLLVTFTDGVKKIYDCSPLLKDDTFKPLINDALFRSVKADEHGYGVIWSDEIDLSESELWLHGIPADKAVERDREKP
ncbi:MAG: DUF2442 domain-containing protein [Desulfobacterales bacterium]